MRFIIKAINVATAIVLNATPIREFQCKQYTEFFYGGFIVELFKKRITK